MKKKILIIDENITYLDKLKNKLELHLHVECSTIDNYSDIQNIKDINSYFIYFIRLNTANYSLIEDLSNRDKNIIILTQNSDDKTINKIHSFFVTDYIITNIASRGDVALRIATRLINNTKVTIMIVDDSPLILSHLALLLKNQNINYIECLNGKEAWEYIKNPITANIDLIITDYEMPIMNGYELTQLIRRKHPMEELPILILSGTEDKSMIARFLKVGANDYLTKPFISEELIARVSNSLTLLEMFKEIQNMAMTDNLTGIHNRNYFDQASAQVSMNALKYNQEFSLCMIDIDNFKRVNDTYGHDTGDKVLKYISKIIKKTLRESDLFARYGGEEFVLLLQNCENTQALNIMQKITTVVAESTFTSDKGIQFNLSISSGLTSEVQSIEDMLKVADSYLYIAKQNGKNRVVTKS